MGIISTRHSGLIEEITPNGQYIVNSDTTGETLVIDAATRFWGVPASALNLQIGDAITAVVPNGSDWIQKIESITPVASTADFVPQMTPPASDDIAFSAIKAFRRFQAPPSAAATTAFKPIAGKPSYYLTERLEKITKSLRAKIGL